VPKAVVCANDQMAIGVMLEFQRSGIGVPGDIAVTGFDNTFAARIVDPPLTTVGQPVRSWGPRRRAPARADRGQRRPAAQRRPAHRTRHPVQLRLPGVTVIARPPSQPP
jgi:LacI family transcriptional regulator